MTRLIISILCIYSSMCSAGTGRKSYMDLSKFMNPAADKFNDIAYTHIVPQYEEVPDPKKAVAIEFFFGEYDGSEKSLMNLAHIKDIIADAKLAQKDYKSAVITMSPDKDFTNSSGFKNAIQAAGLATTEVHKQDLPYFLKKRSPSAFSGGRKFWTFVSFSSSMGGTFGALYFFDGLSAPLAASIAFWPALASGSVTYYSNEFGAFLTNGKWSNWLLSSDSYLAKKFRSGFNINPVTFEESLIQNKEYFKTKHPEMFKKNERVFDSKVTKKTHAKILESKTKLTTFISKLHNIEEYFKWWLTELTFVAVAIKIPQAIAGVGDPLIGIGAMANDILAGSAMSMIAQAPGDIAIQLRKYQMIEELRTEIMSGNIKIDRPDELLQEIEKVLAKTGEHKAYTINDGSHKALLKIENWSRSRATMLSFFSVTGVTLDIAGIPAGKPILIAIGVFGVGYYANVQGWIKPARIKQSVQNFVAKVRAGDLGFSLQFLKTRWCSAKFRYGRDSFITP
jgi:hypothetical protein